VRKSRKSAIQSPHAGHEKRTQVRERKTRGRTDQRVAVVLHAADTGGSKRDDGICFDQVRQHEIAIKTCEGVQCPQHAHVVLENKVVVAIGILRRRVAGRRVSAVSTNAPTLAQQGPKPVQTILFRGKTIRTARAGLAELFVGPLSINVSCYVV